MVAGIAMQFIIAFILLKLPVVISSAVVFINGVVNALSDATYAGTGFVFGYLGGALAPFEAQEKGGASVYFCLSRTDADSCGVCAVCAFVSLGDLAKVGKVVFVCFSLFSYQRCVGDCRVGQFDVGSDN